MTLVALVKNERMADAPAWQQVPIDSYLESGAGVPTGAPVLRSLDLLPTDHLGWEDFERLQWRVLHDVEGLRDPRIYGSHGQAQYGLDIVAVAPDRVGVALQSKRKQTFGPADLSNAVKKFRTTTRPFDIGRLIIGVSREVTSTNVLNELFAEQARLCPIALDLWDKRKLSQLLRDHPRIVIEFFGVETARAFCMPFELDTPRVPAAETVAIQEALARTPGVTTGTDKLIDEARDAKATDPARALDLVQRAQDKLRTSGFPAHAAAHDELRTTLLTNLERELDAARSIVDDVWTALDSGFPTLAQEIQRRLQILLRDLPEERHTRPALQTLLRVSETAVNLHFNPLGNVPEVDILVGSVSANPTNAGDRARLLLLAGETALANDVHTWLHAATNHLQEAIDQPSLPEAHRLRLRLLLADATDDWVELLTDARRGRLGHGLCALVAARHARRCAVHGEFREADAGWEEAIAEACLDRRWEDASEWLLSRRMFRTKWAPFTTNDLYPMQVALRGQGRARRIIPVDDTAHEHTLASLHREQLRSAAVSGQRDLRDAVTTGNWAGETEARKLLAAILARSGEPQRAAHHMARAADTEAIDQLGKDHPVDFIDVTSSLEASNYWTVGTSYRLIAQQADLVPDNLVERIADLIIADLAHAVDGTVTDLRFATSSRYLGAMKALAGLGNRLTRGHAHHALAHFEQQPDIEPDHYRYHDDDEATAVANIGLTHPQLRGRAIGHLVPLLARSQTSRNATTSDLIDKYWDEARSRLEAFADDPDPWAGEMLAYHDPTSAKPDTVEDARKRLTAPLEHEEGSYTVGTRAVADSILIRGLRGPDLAPVMNQLLDRVHDPHVSSSDRGDFLLAASNLAPHLDERDREHLYERALAYATDPAPSRPDDFATAFRHPLGGMRVSAPFDTGAKATYLAALLAATAEERAAVRQLAFSLLGSDRNSEYWVTKTLQEVVGDALTDDVGFLAGQGWPLRSLAAIVWTKTSAPPHIGLRLARDPDVRVRRSFAGQLARTEPVEAQIEVRGALSNDPCYSVRVRLTTPGD